MVTKYRPVRAQCIHVTTVNKGRMAELYLFNQKHGNTALVTLGILANSAFFFFFLKVAGLISAAYFLLESISNCL